MRRVVLILTTLLVACASSPPPSCQDAASHLAKTLGNNPDGATLTIAQCEKQGWSAETRQCLASASSEAAAQRCLDAIPPAEGPAAPPR